MSLHAVSVFDTVSKMKPWKNLHLKSTINPNLPGGGPLWPPPCRFFNGASIPLKISRSSFMTFSPLVSRTFWYQIYPGGTYGTTFMVQ